ncbi:MAG TPA: ankyrin repeat domain-containing protein [Actinophytocola sp.]|uniref:ankyrin repeat domain-containing protein n=1 Tax=Actinophytocola sp. TaxID=1872138 RepID=UPI002E0000D4|nr:ankyrin repeat domain-containing protein [Actinophytocola sp.]
MAAHSVPLNLEQLRKRAKELRDLVRAGHPKFIGAARELHPRWADVSPTDPAWAGFTLADAQLVEARSKGFPSWRRLREYAGMLARYSRAPQRHPATGRDLAGDFLHLACLTHCDGWNAGAGEEPDGLHRQGEARRMLAGHPELASATIHTAAAVGDIAAATALLAADASRASQVGGPHGWPPLLYLAFARLNSTAAGHSTLEVARLLLAHGADPGAGYLPDGEPPPVTALSGAFRGGRDPIHQPAHQHSLALARLLLDAGADPNDQRALSNACEHPHDDDTGLALLLEYGLGRGSGGVWAARLAHDPRRQLPKGAPAPVRLTLTPAQLVQAELRYSAQWNLPNRVRLLLRRCAETGIDINAASAAPGGRDPGPPAYTLAAACGNTEIVDLLAQAGAVAAPLDPTHEFVAACLRADRPAVQRLLAADPGLAERARTVSGVPEPLHLAVALNRPEAVALLASLGFPLDEDWHGWGAPLVAAVLGGHVAVVKLLVELGADPTAEILDDTDPSAELIPHERTPLGLARYLRHHEVAGYLSSLNRG